MIQIIPLPMVQRVMLVQWVFKGWALRKGDGSKWIEPFVPMIHLFWETKRPLLFTVIIAFLAGIWREWVQVREWHSRGRRKKTFHPFVLIRFVSLLLDLYSSPSNACHTDISNLGIHVFWVSHPCTQITATDTETKTLIMHLRGGSRIFFRRGCTRLLLYFNTNKPHKPHSFFFAEYQLY